MKRRDQYLHKRSYEKQTPSSESSTEKTLSKGRPRKKDTPEREKWRISFVAKRAAKKKRQDFARLHAEFSDETLENMGILEPELAEQHARVGRAVGIFSRTGRDQQQSNRSPECLAEKSHRATQKSSTPRFVRWSSRVSPSSHQLH